MHGFWEAEEGLDAPGSTGLRLLAHALHALGAQLGLRLDTFSLGPAASIIGERPCSCDILLCIASMCPLATLFSAWLLIHMETSQASKSMRPCCMAYCSHGLICET
jgi:hypothetical protein